MILTVTLCTRNPRPVPLQRVLETLRTQTLPLEQWELLVVDNGSTPPLAPALNLQWHPQARVVVESSPGLAQARARALETARGAWVVFVDDDNLLAPDYLERALELSRRWPQLGAFGGRIRGEFEVPPTPWFAARLDRLALRDFTASARGKAADFATLPCGAGLCVRRDATSGYLAALRADPRRANFGHRGRQVGAADDLDLVLAVCRTGAEVGRFPELVLTHLIPRERLTLRYFARITRRQAAGQLALYSLYPEVPRSLRELWFGRLAWLKWAVVDSVLSLLPANSSRP